MRQREFTSADEIGRTASLFPDREHEERLRRLRLDNAWCRAVGPYLSTITRPGGYRARRLTVEVVSAAWKRELEHLQTTILARLGQLLPASPVDAIVFRVSAQLAAAGRVSRDGAARARTADLTLEKGETIVLLDHLADGDLRDRLSRVVGRYLAAGRTPKPALTSQTTVSRVAPAAR